MRATVAADYTGVTNIDARRRDGITGYHYLELRLHGFILASTSQEILRKATLSGSHHLFPAWPQKTIIYLYPIRLADSVPVLYR